MPPLQWVPPDTPPDRLLLPFPTLPTLPTTQMACHRAQEEDKRSVGTPCTSAPSTDSTQPWPQEEPAAANVTQRCCFQGCPNVMPHSQSQASRPTKVPEPPSTSEERPAHVAAPCHAATR